MCVQDDLSVVLFFFVYTNVVVVVVCVEGRRGQYRRSFLTWKLFRENICVDSFLHLLYFSNFSKKKGCHFIASLFFFSSTATTATNTISAYDCFQSCIIARRRNQTNKNNNSNPANQRTPWPYTYRQKKQKTKQHLFVIEKWTTNQKKKSKRTKTLSTAPEYFLFCNNFFTTPALFRAGEHFGKNCCAWTWTYARVGVGLFLFDLQTSDIANQRVGEHSRRLQHFIKHRMRHETLNN